mgnify:CR=1 FL=1
MDRMRAQVERGETKVTMCVRRRSRSAACSARAQRGTSDLSVRSAIVVVVPRKQQVRRRSSAGARTVLFVGLALLIVGGALYFSRPKDMAFIEFGPGAAPSASAGADHIMAGATMVPANAPADLTIRVDMGGFTPAELKVPADKALKLKIVNPDNNMHTDGGGWHQFSVPKLNLNVNVPPLTNMIITLPAAQAGDYEFWCDTCCGGKENPSMQGVIRVRA